MDKMSSKCLYNNNYDDKNRGDKFLSTGQETNFVYTSHIINCDKSLNNNSQIKNIKIKDFVNIDMKFDEKVNYEKIKSIFAFTKHELIYYLQKNSSLKGKSLEKKEVNILVNNFMKVVSKFIDISTDSIEMNYSAKKSKRLYAKNDNSIQSLPKIFRNYILPDNVYDYDIIKCHPSIYLYLCKKLKTILKILANFLKKQMFQKQIFYRISTKKIQK